MGIPTLSILIYHNVKKRHSVSRTKFTVENALDSFAEMSVFEVIGNRTNLEGRSVDIFHVFDGSPNRSMATNNTFCVEHWSSTVQNVQVESSVNCLNLWTKFWMDNSSLIKKKLTFDFLGAPVCGKATLKFPVDLIVSLFGVVKFFINWYFTYTTTSFSQGIIVMIQAPWRKLNMVH